jgi:MarC family integral membrane protein
MKYLESLNATFVIDTFLLLLIGVGPKIALVPFLDVTAGMSEATKRRVQRKMLTTAATVAVILLVLGGLLTRLLHFTPGALGIASGIILLIIAVTMVLSQQGGNGGSHPVKRPGPDAGRRVPAGRALPAQPGRDRRPGHLVGGSQLTRGVRGRSWCTCRGARDRYRGVPAGLSRSATSWTRAGCCSHASAMTVGAQPASQEFPGSWPARTA